MTVEELLKKLQGQNKYMKVFIPDPLEPNGTFTSDIELDEVLEVLEVDDIDDIEVITKF